MKVDGASPLALMGARRRLNHVHRMHLRLSCLSAEDAWTLPLGPNVHDTMQCGFMLRITQDGPPPKPQQGETSLCATDRMH
jgi:hypothetical protein